MRPVVLRKRPWRYQATLGVYRRVLSAHGGCLFARALNSSPPPPLPRAGLKTALSSRESRQHDDIVPRSYALGIVACGTPCDISFPFLCRLLTPPSTFSRRGGFLSFLISPEPIFGARGFLSGLLPFPPSMPLRDPPHSDLFRSVSSIPRIRQQNPSLQERCPPFSEFEMHVLIEGPSPLPPLFADPFPKRNSPFSRRKRTGNRERLSHLWKQLVEFGGR